MGTVQAPVDPTPRRPAAFLERGPAHLRPRIGRWVRARHLVPAVALAAFLLRLPGLTQPFSPDESGFLLVARSWSPEPGSLYGPFFVARPPELIALVRVADAVAGPYALRVLGAVCAGLVVLLAAATARLVADDLAARWTALAVAALCVNPLIGTVAVKSGMLALPLLMLGVWAALVALRRGAPGWALLSGLASGLAVGLKQNYGGSLVFALVLIAASAAARQGPGENRRLGRLAAAVLAGFLVPAAVTVGWALSAGVRLETLWYAVAGFRSDAAAVLLGDPGTRADTLAVRALAVGLVPVIGGFLVHLRAEWREDGPLVTAVLAMLAVDVVGVVGGGQYHQHYLFPLVVSAALCVALLARRRSGRGVAMRAVVVGAVLSSIVSIGWWAWSDATGRVEHDAARTGAAIAQAAAPGDTLTVFGGRADAQYASGLEPVYPYLWSLPMRVLDPELRELEALLAGDHAPEWLVQWASFDAGYGEHGERLREVVESRYVVHGPACGDHRVWLRADVERPVLTPDCTGGD